MLPETLVSLLHHCSKAKLFRHGLSLHTAVFKMGMQSDVFISNHVLNMYAKCGSMSLACRVFDEMPERNLVTWSAIISGYDQAGQPHLAINFFSRMRLVPNEYVFSSVISACTSLSVLICGLQVHAQSLKFGYASVSFVSNSLISMYMKCGRCSDALSVFTSTSELNSVSYNAMIAGFVENQQHDRGFDVFKLMCRQGLLPDRFTFVGVMEICMDANDLWKGMELHCQAVKLKLDSTPFVGNVIMTMYSKFNLIEEVKKAFELIEGKDVVSWNTLITGCSHCDHHVKGLKVFKEMMDEVSVKPDDFTFASALAICANLASLHHGQQIHAYLVRTMLDEDQGVGNALINMYAKCGCIEKAYTVFDRMSHHNLVSWNSIIAGYGNHGFGGKAVELFEQLKTLGMKPDSITFVGLLTACNHAGFVDKGRDYFNSMKEIYGIAPNIEHFSCLIDLLGRSGRLHEAEEYLGNFPFGHDPVVLGSLLSACRLHRDVVIGERLAQMLLKFQPVTTSPFVLLSNLYASDEMWDDVAEARKMLKGSGLKKDPGHSLIEVKGNVEKFTIGDFSHPRIEEIKCVLKTFCRAVDEIYSKLLI